MSYPDPKQRTRIGWPIRWAAGLFALLTVAAAAIPAYAGEGPASLLAATHGTLSSTSADERTNADELCAATQELLGSKSSAEAEAEVEIAEGDLDSACAPGVVGIVVVRVAALSPLVSTRTLESTELPGRLAPRAPPLA